MEKRLKEIIISVTNRCNLRCAMCEIPQMQNNNEMGCEEIKKLISDAVILSPGSIVFSGGEPLLRKDLIELISFANQRRINTCLTTNGTLINEQTAQGLASSGVGVVNVSIEGPQDIHDSLRGNGTFIKAVAALQLLSRHKIETTVATVVCRQNYRSLAYVMDLAHRHGVTTVKFQPFSEIFLIKKDRMKDFFCREDILGDISMNMEKVVRLSEEYKIATNPLAYLYSIPLYLCGLKQAQRKVDCPAIWSSCPIAAEGNVYPCWVLSDKILGNVRERRLSEVWNSEAHNRMRRLIAEEGCHGCLMSCYDYNLGTDELRRLVYFKAKKLSRPKFYKRQFYRLCQYIRYFSNKIINRMLTSSCFKRKDGSPMAQVLEEIRAVKDILIKELKS